MTANTVALVGHADQSRGQIAKALRAARYDVFECEELSIATRFVAVVVIDDRDTGDALRARVQAWIKAPKRPRIVVISSNPAAWNAASLVHSDHLSVLPAPSFSWEIVDALRAAPPEFPRRA
jgi:hypothetical protein